MKLGWPIIEDVALLKPFCVQHNSPKTRQTPMAAKEKELHAPKTRQTEEAQNKDETWQGEAK
jgi:hypothetical protein